MGQPCLACVGHEVQLASMLSQKEGRMHAVQLPGTECRHEFAPASLQKCTHRADKDPPGERENDLID